MTSIPSRSSDLTLPAGCLSDLQIDRWHTGECTANEADGHRRHLASCPGCAARVASIKRFTDTRGATLPGFEELIARAEDMAESATEGPRPDSSAHVAVSRRARLWLMAPVLAAALALVWLLPARHSERDSTGVSGPPSGPQERRKGTTQLGAFVQRGGDMFAIASGDAVYPDDALQLVYSAADAMYLAVLGRDGSGRASVYFAADGRAAAIAAGHDQTLPHSIVLDDTPGDEVFFALFCTEPAELREYIDALNVGARDVTPSAGCQVHTLRLSKRPRVRPGLDAPGTRP